MCACATHILSCCCFFFECYGDHRELHVLTHSFPTRRSSDLCRAGSPPILLMLATSTSRQARSSSRRARRTVQSLGSAGTSTTLRRSFWGGVSPLGKIGRAHV